MEEREMGYCVKCGMKVEDDVRFCPQCGAQIPVMGNADYEDHGNYAGGSTRQTYEGQTESYTYSQNENYYNAGSQNENYYNAGSQDGNYYDAGSQNGNYYNAGDQGGEDYFHPEEVKKNKGMGVLSYLGILVLIPLIAGNRKSEYVKFHSNQGLVLFIVSSIIELLDGGWVFGFHSWLNFGGSIFSTIFDILDFACFILMIAGIVTACKGERRELPLIGKIKIFR